MLLLKILSNVNTSLLIADLLINLIRQNFAFYTCSSVYDDSSQSAAGHRHLFRTSGQIKKQGADGRIKNVTFFWSEHIILFNFFCKI